MTMQKVLLIKVSIDRLYVSRKGSGIEFISIEDCVDVTIQGLEEYIKERLIAAANNSNVNLSKKRKSRKQKWEEKQLYGYFKRQIGEIAHKMN